MVIKLPMPCVNVGNCNRSTCPYQHVDSNAEFQIALKRSLEVACPECGTIFPDMETCQEHHLECLNQTEMPLPRRSTRIVRQPGKLAGYEVSSVKKDEVDDIVANSDPLASLMAHLAASMRETSAILSDVGLPIEVSTPSRNNLVAAVEVNQTIRKGQDETGIPEVSDTINESTVSVEIVEIAVNKSGVRDEFEVDEVFETVPVTVLVPTTLVETAVDNKDAEIQRDEVETDVTEVYEAVTHLTPVPKTPVDTVVNNIEAPTVEIVENNEDAAIQSDEIETEVAEIDEAVPSVDTEVNNVATNEGIIETSDQFSEVETVVNDVAANEAIPVTVDQFPEVAIPETIHQFPEVETVANDVAANEAIPETID